MKFTERQQELFDTYTDLVKSRDPGIAGDFAAQLTDQDAQWLYQALIASELYHERLVKTLWFNYKTQKYRW